MGDNKLEWMYRNSNEVVDKEDYLLGKPVDKAFEQSSSNNEIEKDCLPSSIFSNSSSNLQVDVARKIKEDPLELIRQQELERRKQLLKNPVKLKKLQSMLKAKDATVVDDKKKRKPSISSDEDCDIDSLLTSKCLKLMRKHGIKSLAELSSLKVKQKKKKKKKGVKQLNLESPDSSEGERSLKKSKKKRRDTSGSESSSSDDEDNYKSNKDINKKRNYQRSHFSEKEDYEGYENKSNLQKRKTLRSPSLQRRNEPKIKEEHLLKQRHSSQDNPDLKSRNNTYKRKTNALSEEEKQKKLEEMMANAKWRDEERAKNVARYKKEAEIEGKPMDFDDGFMRKQMKIATSSGSVESRIKSNINNIQRSKFSMNDNFARR